MPRRVSFISSLKRETRAEQKRKTRQLSNVSQMEEDKHSFICIGLMFSLLSPSPHIDLHSSLCCERSLVLTKVQPTAYSATDLSMSRLPAVIARVDEDLLIPV